MTAPFSVVIPARYDSSRLPGKVLADIAGKPMLQHTYERAAASGAQRVVVATDDERIRAAAIGFGAEVCMTDGAHASGSARVQEAAAILGIEGPLVNVQADEPMLPPSAIVQVVDGLMANSKAGVATLCEPIRDAKEMHNPNAVKVVMDRQGYALYFSRAPIPWRAEKDKAGADGRTTDLGFRHVGIYAYWVPMLDHLMQSQTTALEQQERLEQLRALYYGHRIHVSISQDSIPAGVDTPEDLEVVRKLMAKSSFSRKQESSEKALDSRFRGNDGTN